MANPRLLTERGPQKPIPECILAREYATANGIVTIETWKKAIRSGDIRILPDDVAIGSIEFVHERLRASGAEPPPPNDYPDVVHEFLLRDIARTTLGDARKQIAESGYRAMFVKPADKLKRFAGFVTTDPLDSRFNGAGSKTSVWIAPPVRFVSEWRIYSVKGEVLAIGAAPDNPAFAPEADRDVIVEIAKRLFAMPNGFAGICYDVGVLDDGCTALIEVNEGYAFGSYKGCTPDALWAVNVARQHQIVQGGTIMPIFAREAHAGSACVMPALTAKTAFDG